MGAWPKEKLDSRLRERDERGASEGRRLTSPPERVTPAKAGA